jgi:hypothetical protein
VIPFLVAALLAGPPTVPVVDCAHRIEGFRPIGSSLPLDLSIGPVSFTGLRFAAQAPRSAVTPARGQRFRLWKSVPVVDAGARVTVVVAPADRPHLRVAWNGGQGSAVTFAPCAPSVPARAYQGTVGARTAFPGGFLVDGPGCRHLQIWVAGRSKPLTTAVSFAAGPCK